MTPADYFPPDYFTARERFRAAVTRLSWVHEAHPIAARGPAGEELTLDVAVSEASGRREPAEPAGVARNPIGTQPVTPAGTEGLRPPLALVISSGVHGPEGPFGSAVQLALLDKWATAGPPPGRVILLHAVSPFGYAWQRRFDENGVDPNRNFLPPGEAYAGSPPGYADLDPLLNPPSPPSDDRFPERFAALIHDRGRAAVLQAIAPGQYEYPRGLFYGGTGPSEYHRLLVAHLPRWLGGAGRVVHIDYHTGLGDRGTWMLLLDKPPTPDQAAWLAARYAADRLEVAGADGHAYPTRGSFGLMWERTDVFPADSLYLCAEFGTTDLVSVLDGIRTENRAWHHGDRGDLYRRRLHELFSPDDPEWQATVLAGGVDVAERSLTGG